MAERVLIVEDSKAMARALSHYVRKQLGYDVDVAGTYKSAQELIWDKGDGYFVALLDLDLPDAHHGEIVDFVLSENIPAIVVTSAYDEKTNQEMSAKGIVDFVIKRFENIPHLLAMVKRIYNNRFIKVLVADDSRTFRGKARTILQRQRLKVYEAPDGVEALETLRRNPDIRLLLTDYHMPNMNGFDLTLKVRELYTADELAIIATSASHDNISALFLKSGANDYVHKESTDDELLCRINMNLNMLELIQETRDLAYRDGLTGLCNRRCFYQLGEELFESGEVGEDTVVAMLDIDHFKKINDTYGHAVGDEVLSELGEHLAGTFDGPGDIVSRVGGEEFCILLKSAGRDKASGIFEALLSEVRDMRVETKAGDVSFTISVGVALSAKETLDDTVIAADRLLYKAKKSGRDTVCLGY